MSKNHSNYCQDYFISLFCCVKLLLPAVRTGSSNTRLFFVVCFFWWSLLAPDRRFSLGQTNTCCKLSVNISIMFGRLAPIRQNLHETRCRKLRGMQCNAIFSTRARTKTPTSFERHWFERVTRADQSLTNKGKQHSTVKCKHILAVLLCFAKTFRESCVEKYQKLNGVDLSATN